MGILTQKNFLDGDFLSGNFLSGEITWGENSQVEMIINKNVPLNTQAELRIDEFEVINTQVESFIDKTTVLNSQVLSKIIDDINAFNTQALSKVDSLQELNTQVENFVIDKTIVLNSQVLSKIIDNLNSLNTQALSKVDSLQELNTQVERDVKTSKVLNTQALSVIADDINPFNTQALLKVDTLQELNTQAEMRIDNFQDLNTSVKSIIIDFLTALGCQVEGKVEEVSIFNSQVYTSNLLYAKCGGFLEEGFGNTSFLANRICGHLRTQVNALIRKNSPFNTQVEMRIDDFENLNTQAEMRIYFETSFNTQVLVAFAHRLNTQSTVVLYNTIRPRILCNFKSRGVDGKNWTSNTTQPGDYSILNVNNDIIESYWRSQLGATTGISLICDTQIAQGIFTDTFFIDGHNLTTSAAVTLEGSNDDFVTTPFTQNLIINGNRIFWIAPTLPLASFKKWKIRINDNTNPDNYIKIGVIVFGAAEILVSTCAVQQIEVENTEYKEAVKTEGYTSVGNSRAVRRAIRLDFRDIEYESGDFQKLVNINEYSRTTLKCLWLPDPRTQSLMKRFAAFGKIKQLPVERHNVKSRKDKMDHIDMSYNIDEGE